VSALPARRSPFALAYAGFAATTGSLAILALCFLLAGIGIGCAVTAEHAAVARLAPENIRGSAFGLLAAVQAFGNLVASSTAGLLYTLASPAAAFSFAVGAMIVSLVLLAAASMSK
jgi:MFS family permease